MYSYTEGDAKVRKSIDALCRELKINHIATATAEELKRDGYNAPEHLPVVRANSSTPVGTLPDADRKPHLMVPTFWSRVDNKRATRFSLLLVRCIVTLEESVQQRHPTFISPLRQSGSVKAWGELAHSEASQHPMIGRLEYWYEALRILVVSWEEAEDAASMMLQMSGALIFEDWSAAAMQSIGKFIASIPIAFPQFESLKQTLAEKLAVRGDSFRGIVFVQQRVMTHILEHVIRTDPELQSALSPVCLYSTSSPATPSFGINKQEARARLASFAAGTSNLLITTVVAEEGMDIPAANVVIRFDAMHHAVSLVQGRGRARQADSDFIVLKERTDRPVEALLAAEQQQASVIRNFQPSNAACDQTTLELAQRSREHGAKGLLAKEVTDSNVLAVFNEYSKKTKATIQEVYSDSETTPSLIVCKMTYESILRTVHSIGTGSKKKVAKIESAKHLLKSLRESGTAKRLAAP
jgi:hypothetical protein